MEKLLSFLKTIPEYELLTKSICQGQSVAVTGIGQINRSHLIAAIHQDNQRPMVLICQDDMAAKRLQEELKSFSGEVAPILPSRELTLYDTAVVSRGWEQKRLRQFYELASGNTSVQIMTWESLSQRTIPPKVLLQAAFRLKTGEEYSIDALLDKLVGAGYSRCDMVEGPGQFALRGGILDVFSPAADLPFRAEFFGDSLDTMGYFDPDTQRRTENVDDVMILPVGETQPRLHPEGISGLCQDLETLIAKQRRRKTVNEALISTLEKDLNKYENNLSNPTSDRYMALIYPDFADGLEIRAAGLGNDAGIVGAVRYFIKTREEEI
jgi:transcription-repair coupling factor (superfamily II helicase)